jgi:hypothetical protein
MSDQETYWRIRAEMQRIQDEYNHIYSVYSCQKMAYDKAKAIIDRYKGRDQRIWPNPFWRWIAKPGQRY